jgi:hypothetical protein
MQSCAVARHDRRDGSVCAVAESTTSCAATSARVSTEKRATDSTWSRLADRSTSEVDAAALTARTSVRGYGHRVPHSSQHPGRRRCVGPAVRSTWPDIASRAIKFAGTGRGLLRPDVVMAQSEPLNKMQDDDVMFGTIPTTSTLTLRTRSMRYSALTTRTRTRRTASSHLLNAPLPFGEYARLRPFQNVGFPPDVIDAAFRIRSNLRIVARVHGWRVPELPGISHRNRLAWLEDVLRGATPVLMPFGPGRIADTHRRLMIRWWCLL